MATAVVARSTVPGVALLSLNDRLRDCGEALGLEVLPAKGLRRRPRSS